MPKYIRFEWMTLRHCVVHNKKSDSPLGTIEWYPRWRQFVLTSMDNVIWSADCLRDVAQEIERVNALGIGAQLG